MTLITPFVKPLQIAINRYLSYDPESSKQLGRMENSVVELRFTLFELSLFVIITSDGLDICDEFSGDADAIISGSPLALAIMGLQESSTASLFSGDVAVVGDVELGTQFQQFLKNIEVDLEEPLSLLTGDVVANQLGNCARDFVQWSKQNLETNGLNMSEFLREEQNLLPTKFEVERFKKQVDDIRLAADRLEAKVQRIVEAKENR